MVALMFITVWWTVFQSIWTVATGTEQYNGRHIHSPDIPALVRPLMSGLYSLDPVFLSAVSHPSRHYTDFFGIHALQNITSDKVVRDFVPAVAQCLSRNESMVTLYFSEHNSTATFYQNAVLNVNGALSATDHVQIGGETTEELLFRLEKFRGILQKADLEADYLIPNPYYEMEIEVNKAFYSPSSTVQVALDESGAQFSSQANAVLIYPDGVHGDLSSFEKFTNLMQTLDFDWLGIEMIPSSMQSALDVFCTYPNDSREYPEARKQLAMYFVTAWTPYFNLNVTNGEDSPYFKVVDLVRIKGGRVYGVDLDSLEFLLFRYGEQDFGAAVRSLNWANSVPLTGRGVIFGGSLHFTMSQPINVQDFLVNRDSDSKLFAVRPLRSS